MPQQDYYDVLGCPPSASQEELRHAYRELAAKLHPDLNSPRLKGWAERRMKELNEAYEVLGDPRRRAEYDRSRRNAPWTQPGPTGDVHPRPPGPRMPAARALVGTVAMMLLFSLVIRFARPLLMNPAAVGVILALLALWLVPLYMRRRGR